MFHHHVQTSLSDRHESMSGHYIGLFSYISCHFFTLIKSCSVRYGSINAVQFVNYNAVQMISSTSELPAYLSYLTFAFPFWWGK